MIHDPALVEVADKLVQPIFAAQRLHPIDTIIGITEYPYLAVEVFVLHTFEPGQDLAEGLKSLDVGLAEGSVQPGGLTQKAQQTRLAVLAGLGPARSNMDRKGERDIARAAVGQGVVVDG